jgi:hypothetical protein
MNHVEYYFILNEMNEKKSLKNYINFHPFWDNQDSYMVWDCDKKMDTPFHLALIFKMLNALGNKTFHGLSHKFCTKLSKTSYHLNI